MTALATRAGFRTELSARLPVALLSLAFLAASFVLIQREFGFRAAAIAAASLATSAGWITYSELCLTDLPLAVFFSLAVFFALPLVRSRPATANLPGRFLAIGVCLGLAMLAKGLVPIALAAPFFWYLRPYWRQWWIAAVASVAVALPWYLAVYLENGFPFVEDFFIKHHFERLYSASLQHIQPWYYYFPVLLAGLYPWTPLFALLARREQMISRAKDDRRAFLIVVVIFGFIFFSVTRNKLPGYLLPLFPSLFAVLGAKFEFRRVVEFSRGWLVPCAILIATIPLLGTVLPQSLSAGRFSTRGIEHISRPEWFYIFVPIVVVFLARHSWAGLLLVLCVVSSGIYVKNIALPALDQEVSARAIWPVVRPVAAQVCGDWVNRDWIYGLSFYRGALIPSCDKGSFAYTLRSDGHGPPVLERVQ